MESKSIIIDLDDENWTKKEYECPECNKYHISAYFTYCPYCGKRINWKEKE